MNILTPSEIDFDKFLENYPEHANVIPASNYAGVVEDYFYGERANSGITLPWSKTHGMIKFRPGEVTVWAGVNGHGKSLVTNQVMLGAMAQNETVCIASMEMKPATTLARMTRQAAGTAKPSSEFIYGFHNWLDSKLWMYDQQGTVKPKRMLGVLRYCSEAIMHAGKKLKINHFVIDSLMKCGIGVDDYNGQKAFIDSLCAHARDSHTHIHLVAHARKSESERRIVDKFDIKGASEITDQVDNVMTVWRNKGKEDEAQKQTPDMGKMKEPDALVICSKQRNGDWEGKISLWFHKDSTQFVAGDGNRPINFYDFEMDQRQNKTRATGTV